MLFLKISAVIVLIIACIAGVSWLTHLHSLLITDISVQGNSAISSQDVKDLVSKEIQGSYFKLFPQSNKFLYPKNKIQTDLLNSFSRIQSVKLSIQNSHTLVVTIQERTPAYTWCTGTPEATDANSDHQCYFMDDQGYIFSDAPIFSGHAYFAFYGLIPDTPIRSHYLNSDKFNMVNTLIHALTSNNIHSYALVANADGIYDLYVGEGTKIIFKDDQDISNLISNFQALIRETKIFASQATSTVSYVDMRFGNKIYYK